MCLCAGEVLQQTGQQSGVSAGSQAVAAAGTIEALSSQLAAAPSNEQKQLLCERLYPLIQSIHPCSLPHFYFPFVTLMILTSSISS